MTLMNFMVPAIAREIANEYKYVAEQEGIPYSWLCAYIAWSISGISSLSDFVRLAPWTHSVSSLSEYIDYFTKKAQNRFMRRMRASILRRIQKNPDEWIYGVDTTKKPSHIQNLENCGSWVESSNNMFFGQNLLVIVAINVRTGATFPLIFIPCEKKKAVKEKPSTGWQLVLQLLNSLLEENFPKISIALDSWFDNVEFMRELDESGFGFVIQLKTVRIVKNNPGKNSITKSLEEEFQGKQKTGVHIFGREIGHENLPKGMQGMKYVADKILFIRSSKTKKFKQVKIAAVYNHPNEKSAFGYYATNILCKPGVWLWQISRWRWNIEVLFRDLKQNLAWGAYAGHDEVSLNFSLIFPFIIISYLRLSDHKYKTSEKSSIGTMLKRIRQEETLRSVDFIINNPNHHLLERFRNRFDPVYANRKPANAPASERILEAA